MTDIMPLHGNVLVRLVEPEELTESGLVIPATAQRDTNAGTVIAVGEGRRLDSGGISQPSVMSGDHVIWRPGASVVEVTQDDGREYVLIDERSLVGRRTRVVDELPAQVLLAPRRKDEQRAQPR